MKSQRRAVLLSLRHRLQLQRAMWLVLRLVAEPPPTVLVADPPPLLKLKRVVAVAVVKVPAVPPPPPPLSKTATLGQWWRR